MKYLASASMTPPGLMMIALAGGLSAGIPAAHGEAVDGTWALAFDQGDGPITNVNTNSPIVGNNTANSAAGEMFHSPFTAMTLANPGEKIVFTGNVTLSGTVNSAASIGTPRTQFRFGLFDGDSSPPDDNGWVGYYMSNRHGSSGTPAGTLARKPVGNSSAYLSTGGQNSLATLQGDGSSASLFHDATYAMNFTIERNASSQLLVSASLSGSNGFTQSLSVTDTTASTSGTYTFDRLGFLLGGNLGTDQAVFSNLDVTFVPVIETLTLEVLAAGSHAGAMRLVNKSDDPIDFSYYEINSAAGSLNAAGWRSLDDQDPLDPPQGWGEGPESDENQLSEALILGMTTVAPGAALPLGQGYAGPLDDLELWVGDVENPLAMGDVEFVLPGDFNGDGDVNTADLAQWEGGTGATSDLGDGDFDGDSDGNDFLDWQRHLGLSPPAGIAAAPVPEPTALTLAAAAITCWLARVRSVRLGSRRR